MKATRRRFWTIPLAALAAGFLSGPAAAQVTTPFIEATNLLGTNYFLGKTGIGTNQPGQMLHVVGDSRLQGGVTVDGAFQIPKQGDLSMGSFTNGVSDNGIVASNLSLRGAWISYDGSAQGVYVASDGKVGVGTATPSAAFHVNGGGQFTDLTVDDELTLGGVARSAWPAGDGLGNHSMTQNLRTAGYWIGSDGDSEGVYVTSAGNVGIGTNSTGDRLSVNGSSVAKGNIVADGGVIQALASSSYVSLSTGRGLDIRYRTDSGLDRAEIMSIDRGASVRKPLLISGSIISMAVESGSAVGIGMVSPSTILAVKQTSSTDPIADSWTTYPCDRNSKYVVDDALMIDYAEALAAVPIYRWKRTPKIDDDELAQALQLPSTQQLWTTEQKLALLSPSDLETKRAELIQAKASLPKFTATRVGLMLDDAQVPREICAEGDPGKGIDLLGYCGYLQAALRDEIRARKALEERLRRVEAKIQP